MPPTVPDAVVPPVPVGPVPGDCIVAAVPDVFVPAPAPAVPAPGD